jgi:hypothetical protein
MQIMVIKPTVREGLLTVRTSKTVHADFKVVAELRGLSMSALVHQFVVNAIREEKARDITAFLLVQERQQAEAGQKPAAPVLRFEKPAKRPKLRHKPKRSKSS